MALIGKIKLYSYYRSSASYRVRIAMNLKGLSYQYIPVHLVNDGGEQLKDDYKQLNPSAELPTIVHDGKSLSQSLGICLYLDDISQNTPRLFSTDIFLRAKMIQACEIINSGIQPLQNLRVLKKLTQDFAFSEQQKSQWIQHWIRLGFTAFEKLIETSAGDFCFANSPSAVDAFLIPQIYNAHRFQLDLTAYPTIQRVEKNCVNLPAFTLAHPDNQPDTPAQ